jgi:hypothetical protein
VGPLSNDSGCGVILSAKPAVGEASTRIPNARAALVVSHIQPPNLSWCFGFGCWRVYARRSDCWRIDLQSSFRNYGKIKYLVLSTGRLIHIRKCANDCRECEIFRSRLALKIWHQGLSAVTAVTAVWSPSGPPEGSERASDGVIAGASAKRVCRRMGSVATVCQDPGMADAVAVHALAPLTNRSNAHQFHKGTQIVPSCFGQEG